MAWRTLEEGHCQGRRVLAEVPPGFLPCAAGTGSRSVAVPGHAQEVLGFSGASDVCLLAYVFNFKAYSYVSFKAYVVMYVFLVYIV